MSAPLVSVIVPCHDLGRYLDETVDSVLAQTYPSFEIIVIDDGSADPFTRDLLSDYRRPKTRVISSEHRGVMHARNLGIAAAAGEYLCALDADDKLEPSYFEKAVRILERDPSVAFVSCWLRTFGEEDWTWRQERCDLGTLLLECTVATPSLVRKAAVLDVGGFDERMPHQGYEDWDLWISLVERGHRGTILPEVLFLYRRRPGSVSRTPEERPDVHLELIRYLVEKHRASYERNAFDLMLRKELEAIEILGANYALEREIDGRLGKLVDLRTAELRRVCAKRDEVEAGARLASDLDRLEREALEQCEAAATLARERSELARRVADLENELAAAREELRRRS